MGFLLDIESGADLRQTFTDLTVTRVAHVDGLQGSDLDAMLWDALQVLGNLGTTDPPLEDIVIGAAHPSIAGPVVTALQAFPVPDCARARVEITYAVPRFEYPPPAGGDGADTKSIRYATTPLQTTKYPVDQAAGPIKGDTIVCQAPPAYTGFPDQTKTISIGRSRGTVTFNRVESSIPTKRMRTYQHTVNTLHMGDIAPDGYPPGTLYCNVIQADPAAQGSNYAVRYEFLYDKDGHQIEAKWEKPPLDVPAYDANSRFDVEVIEAVDFTPLGFDWSD